MILACAGQVRAVAMGGAFALDFLAWLSMGAAMGADLEFLAELLPAVEPMVLRAWAVREDD